MVARSGITTVLPEKEGWKKLGSRVKRAGSVAVLSPGPAYIGQLGMYTNPARKRLIKQLKETNPNLELLDLRQHLARMRMVKQPCEIDAIQTAIDATVSALNHIEKKFYSGAYDNEFEIEIDLTRQFWKKGTD
jgi:Xaa-Pro aminopeptidase